MYTETFLNQFKDASQQSGFKLSIYGKIDGMELPVLERIHGEVSPTIYISAGVHGDEPAPPMAVLELLRQNSLPDDANYTIFPMINPTGLIAGTRENADGVDLNRDYGPEPVSYETRSQLDWIGSRQFRLTLCLHEDYDGQGFYVYTHSRDPDGPDYPGIAISAAEPFTGIDQRTEIDEMPAKNGRMYPPTGVMDRRRKDLPETLRLLWHHGAQVSITTETPSCQPVAQRISAQCAVVTNVISAYLHRFQPGR
jgi:hypothetical protein